MKFSPIILLSVLLVMALLAFSPLVAAGDATGIAPLQRATFTPMPPTATPDPDATPFPTAPPDAYPPPAYPAPSHTHRHETLSKIWEDLFGSDSAVQ